MPPVTALDEPCPFFHFWRHHFWPKLASSTCILNFCRRERSFQWCPDQGDRPNGALDMHKNAQKVEWKTRSKISYHYTWLPHAKNCLSRWCFLRSFLTASKPSRRSITAAKRKENEKKRRQKKTPKIEKPRRRSRYYFCTCPSHNVVKFDACGKKGKLLCCKHIFDRIKANFARSSLKSTKMSKKHIFCKKLKESMG